MSESPVPAPIVPGTPEGGEKPAGFFQNLVDVYVSPREAFTRIARRPAWILPAAAYLVVTLVFLGTWMSRMDVKEFMRAQIEASPQVQRLTAEQREQTLEMQTRLMPITVGVGGVVGPILSLVAVAAFFLFVYRFFYGGAVGFGQSLAVTSWVFFATGLVSTTLILTVMGLKGDWNLSPQEAFQANLALFVDKEVVSKPVYSLLGSIDLFAIWIVFLLATGYAAVIRRPTASAVWGVAVPWALLVLLRMGLATVF